MRHATPGFALLLALAVIGPPPSIADLQDWIFADDFETGDVGQWSAANGPVTVIPEAASDGAFGLRVSAVSGEPGWVRDGSPADETVIRTDFDLDLDGLSIPDGDEFDLFIGWVVVDTLPAFVVSVGREAGQLALTLTAYANPGMMLTAPPAPLPGAGWHRIALEFAVATNPSETGELRVFVDGAPLTELAGFDNEGYAVDSLQLGAVRGVDQGTSGSFDLDVYTSVRLFDPWPCETSGSGEPGDGSPLCLDVEGGSTGVADGGCGDGVVVWEGAEDVAVARGRIGGIYGKPVRITAGEQTGSFIIALDTTAKTPGVAMDDGCNSAVAWRSSLDGEAVFTAVFDKDGVQQTPLTQVSQGTVAEEAPVAAAAADGRYLVAWRRTAGRELSIFARLFAPDATPLGPEFRIDTGAGAVSLPDAAMDAGGRSVAVWETGGRVFGHILDEAGSTVAVVQLTAGPGDGEPAVAMTQDGGFVVVWTRSGGESIVLLRLFDADGGPVSDVTRVDLLEPADCSSPDVDRRADGEIAVVWSSRNAGVVRILGRLVAADGQPMGEPFVLETQGRVWQPADPRVAAAERLLVSYTAETDLYGYTRGALVGVRSPAAIFLDDFEGGDPSQWSGWVP